MSFQFGASAHGGAASPTSSEVVLVLVVLVVFVVLVGAPEVRVQIPAVLPQSPVDRDLPPHVIVKHGRHGGSVVGAAGSPVVPLVPFVPLVPHPAGEHSQQYSLHRKQVVMLAYDAGTTSSDPSGHLANVHPLVLLSSTATWEPWKSTCRRAGSAPDRTACGTVPENGDE